MTAIYTLSKNERLKSLKAIKSLFENGQKFKGPPLLIYFQFHVSTNEESHRYPLKMGVSVGAKHFKRAVDRNLLKRRIREAYRQQKIPLQELLLQHHLQLDVFFVFAQTTVCSHPVIWDAMKTILEKLSSITVQKQMP